MSDLTSFFDEVRQRLLLSDLIRASVKLTKRGREFSGLCPFHNEKGPSFTVNDEKGFYHCFGCSAHGSHVDFLMKKQGLPFREAIEVLSEKTQVPLPLPSASKQSGATPAKDLNKEVYKALEAATCWFEAQLHSSRGQKALDYLRNRGVKAQSISKFRLGYAPFHGLKDALLSQGFSLKSLMDAGLVSQPEDKTRAPYERFRDRLMFPIHDIKGAVIAFGGRLLETGDPKYLNSPETVVFHKGKTLYSLHNALSIATHEQPFIVVEGYMDVIALHQAGYTTAVAPLGTALTPEQLSLLWRRCARPLLCFDGDEAGRKAANRAALKVLDYITESHSLSFCFLPHGEDPDSLLRHGQGDVFKNLIKKPLPLVDALWHFLMKDRPFSTPEDKANTRKEMKELVQTIKNEDLRYFYLEDFKGRLNALFKQSSPYFSKQERLPTPAAFKGILTTKKNNFFLMHKILLAIILNHPILLGQVIEQLMAIEDLSEDYNCVRQEMVDIILQNPCLNRGDLIDTLCKKGFTKQINELTSPLIGQQAPFTHPLTSLEVVQRGWQDVWMRLIDSKYLTDETEQAAVDAKSMLDFSTWERLKKLKQTFLKQ